ncbi:MAG: S8/S53 family peptidase [Nakamurella sp.]
MSTVDHRSGVHNLGHPLAAPIDGEPGPYSVFRPCRAIGGAILPVPMESYAAFQPNNEDPDKSFVVGVVDTGLVLDSDRQPHPWLAGHVAFDPEHDDDPLAFNGKLRSDDGHGTFVTGLVLREAPRAYVRAIRGMDRDLFGDPDRPTPAELRAADSRVAGAIYRLLDPAEELSAPASIINLSFYGVFPEAEPPILIRDAIQAASDAGVVVIVAAGNQPRRELVWPAAFARDSSLRNMHVVGAVDETVCRTEIDLPFVATFSNHQEWVRTYANGAYVNGPLYSAELIYNPADRPELHDFFLPAKSPAAGPTPATYAGWAKWSGTSFAAATVSGIIAARAMADRSISVAQVADQVLRPNAPIDGTDVEGLVCYVQGVDSDWPSRPPSA